MELSITPYIVAISTATPLIIERIKTSPAFPEITPQTTARLTALSVLMTAVGAVIAMYQAGTFDVDTSYGLFEALANFIAAFGLTELFYKYVIKPIKSWLVKEGVLRHHYTSSDPGDTIPASEDSNLT